MDMLIKLYELPLSQAAFERLDGRGICVRRAMANELGKVIEWIRKVFSDQWADECLVAFGRQPVGCYVALKYNAICGFCCLDTTFRNFIGPIGIEQKYRSQGVGRGLLISAANELYLSGFAYAVIGDVGSPEFFKRVVNAMEIPDSTPGAYPRKI